MYSEDELIPLSALQHYVVCPRQCALIHVEQTWIENTRTAEGRVAHEKVDRGGTERRGGMRRAFGIPLRNLTLGLSGKADVVEFHAGPDGTVPFPVEHKLGRPKKGDEDRVQLCAQALCLEEMFSISVPEGALFYGQKRRRLEIVLDADLRARTASIAYAVHALFETGVTPPPPAIAPCENCSLQPSCLPGIRDRSASRWLSMRLSDEDL